MIRWRERCNMPRGEILSPKQIWTLAKVWYGNRLSPDFYGRTAEEAQQIFSQLGFRSPFWMLDG